jgi:hypothetical protein
MSVPGSEISEKQVVDIWQKQVQRQRLWSDSEGNPVEILYPGRANDNRGGDFRDALITLNRGDKQGFIEVHTSSGRWFSHGHHLDPAYNQVVLHVVWEPEVDKPVVLQNGQPVPTISLKESALRNKSGCPSKKGLPCRGIGRKWSPLSIQEVLNLSGDIRFEAAVSRYTQKASLLEPEQSLFEGILEALGYSKNRIPFKSLAGLLPLRELDNLLRNWRTPEEALPRLQAVLFGRAGLLPYQRIPPLTSDDYSRRMEALWSARLESGSRSVQNWELFKVRPGNHPVLRIAALSHLLYRWRAKGCLETLVDQVRETSSRRANSRLEAVFLVSAGDYWEDHIDFGSLKSRKNPGLLGRPRAAEIIINVLLPFCSCWGGINSEPSLCSKAREIYANYPRLESNAIERHMLKQLDLDIRCLRRARCQQGLLQIYKTLCIEGKCADCGLSG